MILADIPIFLALCGAAALFLTYYTVTSLRQWLRLRHIPGPPLAGFTHLWILVTTLSGTEPFIYQRLAKEHHPSRLLRVSPNLLLTSDPIILRRMSAARSPYGKDMSYRASTPRHPSAENMLSTTDIEMHDARKSQLLGAYNVAGRMESAVDCMVARLVASLLEATTTIVDFCEVAPRFTLDVVLRVALGKDLGYLAGAPDTYHLMKFGYSTTMPFALAVTVPWFRALIGGRIAKALLAPKASDESGFGPFINFCEDAVRERYESKSRDDSDLLDAAIRSGLDADSCMSEMVLALVAGSETTASTIRWTMLQLLSTPRVYSKLKAVVKEAVDEGRVSTPIKQAEAKEIPYLQAVIYEGLRVRPPGPSHFAKIVPPEGDVLDGKFIPGGTAIGWNLLPIVNSVETFGSDPESFRPERFMEADDNKRATMERLVELEFGYGRFGCAGKSLALMELNKIYFELFRYLDFQIVNPATPLKSQFVGFWMDSDFWVRVTEARKG